MAESTPLYNPAFIKKVTFYSTFVDDLFSYVEWIQVNFGPSCKFSFVLDDYFCCIDGLYDCWCNTAWEGSDNERYSIFLYETICWHL